MKAAVGLGLHGVWRLLVSLVAVAERPHRYAVCLLADRFTQHERDRSPPCLRQIAVRACCLRWMLRRGSGVLRPVAGTAIRVLAGGIRDRKSELLGLLGLGRGTGGWG